MKKIGIFFSLILSSSFIYPHETDDTELTEHSRVISPEQSQQSTLAKMAKLSSDTFDVTRYYKNMLYSYDPKVEHFVKKAILFDWHGQPKNISPIVLVIIHGTWAKGASDDFGPELKKPGSEIFRGIKHFAQKLSFKENRPVLLLSFGWSGYNDEQRRRSAGAVLRNLLKVIDIQLKPHSIQIIAHSHGGNVAAIASHPSAKGELLGRPIDKLYNLGTPTRSLMHEAHYRQGNIKETWNIYSPSDPVQVMGSVQQEQMARSLQENFNPRRQPCQTLKQRIEKGENPIRVINIHVKIDGVSPGHISIKDLIPGLFEITEVINNNYQIHTDFVINIASRNFLKRPVTVLAAINDFLTTRDLVQRYDLLDSSLFNQIKKEVNFSQKQENSFKKRYTTAMRSKGSVLVQLSRSMIDMYRFVKYYAYAVYKGLAE